eukprot:scaffold7161_cov133-Cylindrotheca_fusiformis.AAC.11
MPTKSPTVPPTKQPTSIPTLGPTARPTRNPSAEPTQPPTLFPTERPTGNPTGSPSSGPTHDPTKSPTLEPTSGPTPSPTSGPTLSPTFSPTSGPTLSPTFSPTSGPTYAPTSEPTSGPTSNPTSSVACEVELAFEESDIDWPTNAGPEIVQVDDLSATVTVRFKQTFETKSGRSSQGDCTNGQIDWIALVHEDAGLNQVCDRSESLCFGDSYESTLQCDPNDDFAILTVYVSDDHASFSTSENENPGSCTEWTSDNTNVAKYKFMIPCKAKCGEFLPPRELLGEASEKEDVSQSKSPTEISQSEESPMLKSEAEPSEKQETPNLDHYCSNTDFPCGMDKESVHVCHYSARTGYQTFCVSEEDSDILSYYPKDYCGPCLGGFSESLRA